MLCIQDLSQPNSEEANPPDGDLTVPLLRHQVGQCHFPFDLMGGYLVFWNVVV